MRIRRKAFINILCITAAVLLQSLPIAAQESAADIIRRSAKVEDLDWAAAPQFDNSERDRDKDGDKTYEDTMLFGSPYQRLMAENGHPLSSSKQKEEQEKYDKAVAERQHESPDQRSQRIAKYQADRKRNHTLIEQMTTAFDFHLAGKQVLNGHKAYVLKATPRQGYKPPDRDTQVLTGMEGTLWIDQKTFQWVKAEAHVIHPVKIEGFIAQVEPGTRFELEKRPVAGDVWLASHFSMRSNAKIMLLFRHKGEEDDSFFNYHKSTNASSGE